MMKKRPKPPTGLKVQAEPGPAPPLSGKELVEGPIVSAGKGCESACKGASGEKQAKVYIIWSELGTEAIIAYAQKIVDEKCIKGKAQLLHEQPKVYWALWRRKLLDSLGYAVCEGPEPPPKKRTRWDKMGDEALVSTAQKLVDEEGLEGRSRLRWRFSGLCKVLEARGLLDKVHFQISAPERCDWKSMGDNELVACAQKLIDGNSIRNGKAMRRSSKEANNMHSALRRRNLLVKVVFLEEKKVYRDWTRFSDEELLEHARSFVQEAGITRRTGLYAADKGLCWVLHHRGLFEKVGFGGVKRRNWRSMGDGELLESAGKLIKESQAWSIGRLTGVAHGLCNELKRRGLTGKLIFAERQASQVRDGSEKAGGSLLSRMGDAELVEHAKGYISQYGITTRPELRISNKPLYWRLEGKGLLADAGLPSTKMKGRDWDSIEDPEILSQAKKLIDENSIRCVSQLFALDQQLCNQLRERGLYDKAGLSYKHRRWSRMSDDLIVSLAQSVIDRAGAANLSRLAEIDPGLDAIVGRRNLTGRLTFKDDKDRYGAFSEMDDAGLLSEARELMERHGIKAMDEMRKQSFPLYAVMKRKDLLGSLGLIENPKEKRGWQSMSDDEVIAYAKRVIEANHVKTRSELDQADKMLLEELRSRKLLDGVIPSRYLDSRKSPGGGPHFFASKSDSELLEMARKLVAEKGMKMKKELRESHPALYAALLKRGILDELVLENSRLPSRDWLSYKDDDLVGHATSFVEENGIQTSSALKEKDCGLHEALRKRGLLAKMNFKEGKVHTPWRKMSDAELVGHARSYLSEKGLEGRNALFKENLALYTVLLRRDLADTVFADIESSCHREAIAGVLDAIESFDDDE